MALALPASAAPPLQELPYDALAPSLTGRVDFNDLPALPEPGHDLSHGYAAPGARLGERFVGQTLLTVTGPQDGQHDTLDGLPTPPLRLEPGAPGAGLSVSFHRAFRSNALYPLGPLGWPVPEARGEGVVAILFARDTCALAVRIHTEYVDALGSNSAHRGNVTFAFYARDGARIDRIRHLPGGGITGYGFARPDNLADIAGVTITNLDKGGIAIDDIRFGCVPLTG
ncbi:MAG: hypothetical protein JXJ18_00705 [Rhodobacteraceae bacterium]|nr:hypothetical protein [Paracoccaceae bacterium]